MLMNRIRAFFGSFRTIEEMANEQYNQTTDAERNVLTSMDRDEMIKFHHWVGRHVRNKYQLWNPKNPLTKQWFLDQGTGKYIVEGVDEHPCHPDAVSMLVLYRIWDLANNR